MQIGRITSQGDALLPVALITPRGAHRSLGVVDTGFNGHLSVPLRLVQGTGWMECGTQTYELADGTFVSERMFIDLIEFDARRRRVLAVGSRGNDILIGTRLLAGRLCEFDYVTRMVRLRRGGVLRRQRRSGF